MQFFRCTFVMMKPIRFASIDIGSNAIRLLVKEFDLDNPEGEARKLQLFRVPLRLGSDAFSEGKIGKASRRKLIHVMRAFHELLLLFEVESYRACATSAMREARNRKKIIAEVRLATGVSIEVVSGEEEARLVSDIRFRYAQGDSPYVLFVDVGGGSTELNLFHGGVQLSRASFNIGTVRVLTGTVKDDAYRHFEEALNSFKAGYSNFEVVGTGGNINKLVRLAKENPAYRGMRFITYSDLKQLYDTMKGMSVEERMVAYNLKPDRADVIVPAAEIFLHVVETLQATGVSVPTAGLSDGIIFDLFCNYCKKHKIPLKANEEDLL